METADSFDSNADLITSPTESLYYCQYGVWYPLFKKHAPKSTVLNISDVQPEFIDWMHLETIVLPAGSGPSTQSENAQIEDSDDSEDSSDGDCDETPEPRLDALDAEIRRVLLKYEGGPLFPKLNWSAPLDASFMLAGNNLQCQHPEDIYLLLKSSEFAATDMEQIQHLSSKVEQAPSKDSSMHTLQKDGDVALSTQVSSRQHEWQLQLVLKQWFAFNKSYEFRCFVRGSRLIAISQRDLTFYPHLQPQTLRDQIKDKLWDFWSSALLTQSEFPLKDYIFDAYLTKDRGRVWLVDINPWLPRTDPLLFTYKDLEALHGQAQLRPAPSETDDDDDDIVRIQIGGEQRGGIEECPWDVEDVDFRVLTDERMHTGSATYSANMVPRDLVDFAQRTAGTAEPGESAMSVDQVVSQWNQHVMGQEERS